MNCNSTGVIEEPGVGSHNHLPGNALPGDSLTGHPSFKALAFHAIVSAGPEFNADLQSVLAGILRMANTQIYHWFAALQRPSEAELIAGMIARPDFTEQMLWNLLSGDPGKVQVSWQLSQFLDSDLVYQILLGSIRQGNHSTQHPQAPRS